MANKQEIVTKLNELLKKSDDFQKDLKQLSDVILYSGILDEKPVLKEELPPPIEWPKIVPVNPPVTIEPKPEVENFKPKEEKPLEAFQPKNEGFVFIKEKSKAQDTSDIVEPQPKKVKASAKPWFSGNSDLEKFVGERLLTFIGIAVLVTGIVFFVKYAIDKDWINETGRTFIGILAGGVLIGIAHRLRKNFRTFSSVLVGGGIAAEYFTIGYAYHVYQLFPNQISAVAVLVGITLFTVLLAVLYDRRELAIIAIVGGFLTPVIANNGSGNITALGAYLLVLNIGMLTLAYFKKWREINLTTYIFTLLLYGSAIALEIQKGINPEYNAAFGFITAHYFVFFLMNVIYNVKTSQSFTPDEIILLLSNTACYYAGGYILLGYMQMGEVQGIFTSALAVFNFVFAYLLYKRQGIDRNLVYLLIGVVITFISLAGPIQLDGNYITLFWAAEMVLLFWLFTQSKIALLRYASAITMLLTLFSLISATWINTNLVRPHVHLYSNENLFINRYFLTGLFVFLALGIKHYLVSRWTRLYDSQMPGQTFYKRALGISAFIVLYISFCVEFISQMLYHNYSGIEIAFALGTFTAVYANSLYALVYMRKMSHLYLTTLSICFCTILLAAFYTQPLSIQVRNAYLMHPSNSGIYALHYLMVFMNIISLFFIYKFIRTNENYKHIMNPFYWFMAVMGIYLLSCEIDHAAVTLHFSGSYDDINYALERSHKIAFPVAWGVVSLILMVIGMRKQIQQLRIISLSLFAMTIGKLILLGFYGGSEAGKIIAFISSGIIIMVVAFMYQKLKKIITEKDKQEHEK